MALALSVRVVAGGVRFHEVRNYAQCYGATIVDGAWLTLQLSLLSMALAIALGLLGAAIRLSPVKWISSRRRRRT